MARDRGEKHGYRGACFWASQLCPHSGNQSSPPRRLPGTDNTSMDTDDTPTSTKPQPSATGHCNTNSSSSTHSSNDIELRSRPATACLAGVGCGEASASSFAASQRQASFSRGFWILDGFFSQFGEFELSVYRSYGFHFWLVGPTEVKTEPGLQPGRWSRVHLNIGLSAGQCSRNTECSQGIGFLYPTPTLLESSIVEWASTCGSSCQVHST